MITAIYLSHNRLDFVKQSFLPFMRECKSSLVKQAIIYDDNSTDGTSDFLMSHYYNLPLKFRYIREEFNSSWKQINSTYPIAEKYILKVDNDIVIPNSYVKYLFDVMEKDNSIGFAGLRTGKDCYIGDSSLVSVRNIGGVGLFRTEEIKRLGGIREPMIKEEKRFFGFTDLQNRSNLKKVWVDGMVKDLSKVLKDKQNEYINENWTRWMN